MGGPPGRDIDIRIIGDDLKLLKSASDKVLELAKSLPGASDVTSNLKYGAEEIHIALTPKGKSMGFSTFDVGDQVRSALEGSIVKRFARGDEEVTVRVKLPSDETKDDNLAQLKLISPNGSSFPQEFIKSPFLLNTNNGTFPLLHIYTLSQLSTETLVASLSQIP